MAARRGAASYRLLKRDTGLGRGVEPFVLPEKEIRSNRIRCPLCSWQPKASSRWCCDCVGTPEPYFESCGTVWNTFSTRGRCPGCGHQWKWTTCLRCTRPSLHEDWYEQTGGGGPS